MAPRSRQTRHQDAASRSRQGQIVDLDPTDGLPVQRHIFTTVRVNQDASAETTSNNPKSTTSAEWAAQFNTPTHPWPELPLPSYFHQLAPLNQELIRRARAGNPGRILSQWDSKTNSWISGAEMERKQAAALKAGVNQNDAAQKPRDGEDAESPKSADDSAAEDSSRDGEEDEDDGDETAPFKTSTTKRRKIASHHHKHDDTRFFDVRKWVPAPASQPGAHDRTFLAPRRPGMPYLYNNPEYSHQIFGQYHSSAAVAGPSSYDLGEGGGLSNASGVLAAGTANEAGTSTPRKNIPPRRKKKKLGGPGRKKANPNPTTNADGIQSSAVAGTMEQAAGGDAMQGVEGQGQDANGVPIGNEGVDNAAEDDGDEGESSSDGEGSEEGEIDEGDDAAQPEEGANVAATTTALGHTNLNQTETTSTPTSFEETKVVIEDGSIPTIAQTVLGPSASTEQPEMTYTSPQPAATATIIETDTEMVDSTTEVAPTLSPAILSPPTQPQVETEPSIPQPTDPEEIAIVKENADAVTGDVIVLDKTPPSAGQDDTLHSNIGDPIIVPSIPEPTPPAAVATIIDVPETELDEKEVAVPTVIAVSNTTDNLETNATDHLPSSETAKELDDPSTVAGKETGTSAAPAEVDFLGGLDAAIDREVSESGA